MKRQRNLAQMREEKSLEKELNKMEASNLPDIPFKAIVIRMLNKLSENFKSIKKDIKTIKKEPLKNGEYDI